MDAMVAEIVRRGGLMATHELHEVGYDRRAIAAAVLSRRVLRVRQGWYSAPDTHRLLLSAARVGGPATCVTALALRGVWTPQPAATLHVACKAHDARLRGPRDSRIRIVSSDPVRVHWRHLPASGSRLMLDPLESLRDATSCVDAETLAVMADSVLHRHPELHAEWRVFCESLPAARRSALLSADGICESGIETLTWLRIRDLPVELRRQVRIGRIGRVDFVVGERLIIEVDGEAYHTDPRQFESDRARDALLATRGYIVLRFSYRQVTERWAEVKAAIEGMLGRGLHIAR